MMRILGKAAVAASVLAMLASAMPVFADDATNTDSTGSGTTTKEERAEKKKDRKEKKEVDLACMQSAVDRRETAVAAGFDAYTGAIKAGLSARKAALADAWKMTERKDRRAAIRAAWKGWSETRRSAAKTWREAKRAAWSQFYGDRKACGAAGTSDDGATAAVDAQI